MSYTRINPSPVLNFHVEDIASASASSTTAAGGWGDVNITVPTVAGYECIGIMSITIGSPSQWYLLGFNLWSDRKGATVRMKNGGTSAMTLSVAVKFLYVKVS